MTDKIFGSWDAPPKSMDHLAAMWHVLAAQNVGTADFIPNSGLSQKRHEITMLWSLFERAKPRVIVEVGVAQGGTLAGWCILAPDDACIIAIDKDLNDCRPRPNEPVHPSIYNGQLKITNEGGGAYNLKKHGQTLHCINGWSTEERTITRLHQLLDGDMIDFLWNDASHGYSDTMRDWEFYWPMVADGGIYAMHDIMPSAHPDVTRSKAFEEIKANADYSALYEFKGPRHQDSMGISAFVK